MSFEETTQQETKVTTHYWGYRELELHELAFVGGGDDGDGDSGSSGDSGGSGDSGSSSDSGSDGYSDGYGDGYDGGYSDCDFNSDTMNTNVSFSSDDSFSVDIDMDMGHVVAGQMTMAVANEEMCLRSDFVGDTPSPASPSQQTSTAIAGASLALSFGAVATGIGAIAAIGSGVAISITQMENFSKDPKVGDGQGSAPPPNGNPEGNQFPGWNEPK